MIQAQKKPPKSKNRNYQQYVPNFETKAYLKSNQFLFYQTKAAAQQEQIFTVQ
jgi:hypothetical protein